MTGIELNSGWRLLEMPLTCDRGDIGAVAGQKDGWLCCELPADVRMPLMQAGIIRDPVLADYCHESEWIERRSWWFRREFTCTAQDLDCDSAELYIESIDTCADIFVNDAWIGSHANIHRPFAAPVRSRLREGANTVTVRVTTGLETVSDADLAEINWVCSHEENNGIPDRGDRRRAFVRRPQYSVGWDWGPRVVTCGIVGKASLDFQRAATIRDVKLVTAEIGECARIDATLQVELLDIVRTEECDIALALSYDGTVVAEHREQRVLLTSGLNYIDAALSVARPQLWWPNGYGNQPLYDVTATITCRGNTIEYPPFRFGIRTIALDTAIIEGPHRNFTVKVNGVPVYCRGGDWIPSDSIYARVSAEKYRGLITEAAAGNFNMLRIWGGGRYEYDLFYDLCDENGILIWHDFMFACSAYPDHRESFRDECRKEMDYQTRRLASRACLALWCGNNENHWIFTNAKRNNDPVWGLDLTQERQYGLYISNVVAKRSVRENCPHIPYWNSSPYGGDFPGGDEVGNVHRWHEGMMHPDMAVRIDPMLYDETQSKFVSEYGYPGPCSLRSIEQYFDGKPVECGGKVWELHNNAFEKKTVNAGLEKHYVDDATALDLEDYILYAGMAQSLMLGYSLEAMRFKQHCSGSLFWMYNDTWGEVGWTTIDYYLRRKPSFYGVARAFAPVKLTLRRESGDILLQGMNDTAEAISFSADVGYLSFDGRDNRTKRVEIKLLPHFRGIILTLPDVDADYSAGSIAVIPDAHVAAIYLRTTDFKQLKCANPLPEIVSCVQVGDDVQITLSTEQYSHGVHIKGDWRCSDNYFDMLPEETRTITIRNAIAADMVVDNVRKL